VCYFEDSRVVSERVIKRSDRPVIAYKLFKPGKSGNYYSPYQRTKYLVGTVEIARNLYGRAILRISLTPRKTFLSSHAAGNEGVGIYAYKFRTHATQNRHPDWVVMKVELSGHVVEFAKGPSGTCPGYMATRCKVVE